MVECCFSGCRWVKYPGSGSIPCPTCDLNARAARVSKGLPQDTVHHLLNEYCTAAESLAGQASILSLGDLAKEGTEEDVPSVVPEGASSPSGAVQTVRDTDSSGSESSRRRERRGPLPSHKSAAPSSGDRSRPSKRERPQKVKPSAKADIRASRKKRPFEPKQPAGAPPEHLRAKVKLKAGPTADTARVAKRSGSPKIAPKPSKRKAGEPPPEPKGGSSSRRVRDRSPTPHPRPMGDENWWSSNRWGSGWSRDSWDSRGGPSSTWEGHSWSSSDRPEGNSWEDPGSREGEWGYRPTREEASSWQSRPPPALSETERRLEIFSQFAEFFPDEVQELRDYRALKQEEESRRVDWPSPAEKTSRKASRAPSQGRLGRRRVDKGGKGSPPSAKRRDSPPRGKSSGKGKESQRKGTPIRFPSNCRNWLEVAFSLSDEKAEGPATEGEGKFSFGGGWKSRQWKDWLRQFAILPALQGEEPAEELTRDFPGWEEAQGFAQEKFNFSEWLEQEPSLTPLPEAPGKTQEAEAEESEEQLAPSASEEPPPRRSAYSAPVGDQELRPGGGRRVVKGNLGKIRDQSGA